jgi:hypothetical protein
LSPSDCIPLLLKGIVVWAVVAAVIVADDKKDGRMLSRWRNANLYHHRFYQKIMCFRPALKNCFPQQIRPSNLPIIGFFELALVFPAKNSRGVSFFL